LEFARTREAVASLTSKFALSIEQNQQRAARAMRSCVTARRDSQSPSFDVLRSLLADMEALVRDIEFAKVRVGFEIKTDRWGNPVAVAKPLRKRYFCTLKAFFLN
jgi:hypothetical protein